MVGLWRALELAPPSRQVVVEAVQERLPRGWSDPSLLDTSNLLDAPGWTVQEGPASPVQVLHFLTQGQDRPPLIATPGYRPD